MKKLFILLLAVCILLSLGGCGNETKEPTVPNTEPTYHAPQTDPPGTTPAEPEAGEGEGPVAVSLCHSYQEELSSAGELIYYFQQQTVTAELFENQKAQEKLTQNLKDFYGAIELAAQTGRTWALDAYDENISWETCFTSVNTRVGRTDSRVISLVTEIVEFAGGAHPSVTVVCQTYDTATGEPMGILDLMDAEGLATLEAAVLAELGEHPNANWFFDDYTEAVSQRFDPHSPDSVLWYLTDKGIVYPFAPYEIAPYSKGTVTVCVPYEALRDVMGAEYAYVEPTVQEIALTADISSNIEEDFSRTFQVVTDKEGERISLYGFKDSAVRISVGFFDIRDNVFQEEYTLFSGWNLGESDCVEIVTYIPDAIPNIRIEVDGSHVLYLSQSGEDGSILLLKEGEF